MKYEDLFQLKGCIAVVVGGGGGIGSEICKGLAHYGANIAIVGRDGGKVRQLAREIEAKGRETLGLMADATKREEVTRMVEATVQRFGRIDIMVNCVGTHVDTPAEEFREEDWDRVLNTNLKAAFLLAQAVGKQMITQKRGKIINISSVRSALGIRSGFAAYCASKGGMNMLTKQLATEWAKYKINVNAVAPTFIRTELVAHYLNNKDFYQNLVNRIPLQRVGETIDLVGAVVFLSSSASDFVTGQVIFVDGGVTACQ